MHLTNFMQVKVIKNIIHEGRLHLAGALVNLADNVAGTQIERGNAISAEKSLEQLEKERKAIEAKIAEEKAAVEKAKAEAEQKAENTAQTEQTTENAGAEKPADQPGTEGQVAPANIPSAPQV